MAEVSRDGMAASDLDDFTLSVLDYLKLKGVLEEGLGRKSSTAEDEKRPRGRLDGDQEKEVGFLGRIHNVGAWLQKLRPRRTQKKARGEPNVTWPEVAGRLNTLCMVLTFLFTFGTGSSYYMAVAVSDQTAFSNSSV